MSLNIIFAGTPSFATPALEALIQAHYPIQAVLTQPDRPSGRGQKLMPSPVKKLAIEANLTILQPPSLREASVQATLHSLHPDIIIVAAYGLIFPEAVLAIPKWGCWNIHASLLPRWRGASPICQAILAGDQETGISIMKMEKGLDTGPVAKKRSYPITESTTSAVLEAQLAKLGAQALMDCLSDFQAGKLVFEPQVEQGVSYAPKVNKEDALIDWSLCATVIDRMIRAYQPWPIAFTYLNNEKIRIWGAHVLEENQGIRTASDAMMPGKIAYIDKTYIGVETGDGILCVTHLQLPGGKILEAKQLLAGRANLFQVGNIFNT